MLPQSLSRGPGISAATSPPGRGARRVVPAVSRIAVLRANALGDFVFALPALEALRAAYPTAEIVLLARDWHAELLRGRPGPVDRVVPLPLGALGDETERSRVRGDVRERTVRSLRREAFDIALQMHGGGRHSNPFLLGAGARVTAGLRAPDAVELDRTIPYVYLQSEVMRLREVAALVGAREGPLEPALEVTEEDAAEARRVVGTPGARPWAVLHPGATDSRRRWPAASFAALGDALHAAGADVIVTGDAAEQRLAESVVEAMTAPAVSTAGRLSLHGLTGLLSASAVVVANDTGPLHLARAVGAATVGVYVSINVVNSGPSTRERHRMAIEWRLDCPVCGLENVDERCRHNESFVARVTVEEVATHALELLAETRRTRARRWESRPVQACDVR